MKRAPLIAFLAVGLLAAFVAAGCGSESETVGANDVEASRKFYDAALGALGVPP